MTELSDLNYDFSPFPLTRLYDDSGNQIGYVNGYIISYKGFTHTENLNIICTEEEIANFEETEGENYASFCEVKLKENETLIKAKAAVNKMVEENA